MNNLPRTIRAQIIVRSEQSLSMLNEAVCRYFESKGFKATLPHVYPEDPLIIECLEDIPTLRR